MQQIPTGSYSYRCTAQDCGAQFPFSDGASMILAGIQSTNHLTDMKYDPAHFCDFFIGDRNASQIIRDSNPFTSEEELARFVREYHNRGNQKEMK